MLIRLPCFLLGNSLLFVMRTLLIYRSYWLDLFFYLSIYLFIYLPVGIFIYLFIWNCLYSFHVHPYIRPSIHCLLLIRALQACFKEAKQLEHFPLLRTIPLNRGKKKEKEFDFSQIYHPNLTAAYAYPLPLKFNRVFILECFFLCCHRCVLILAKPYGEHPWANIYR